MQIQDGRIVAVKRNPPAAQNAKNARGEFIPYSFRFRPQLLGRNQGNNNMSVLSQDAGQFFSGRRIGGEYTQYNQNYQDVPYHESYSAALAMGCPASIVKNNQLISRGLCLCEEDDISYEQEHSQFLERFSTREFEHGEISSRKRCSSFTTESSGDDNQVVSSPHHPCLPRFVESLPRGPNLTDPIPKSRCEALSEK